MIDSAELSLIQSELTGASESPYIGRNVLEKDKTQVRRMWEWFSPRRAVDINLDLKAVAPYITEEMKPYVPLLERAQKLVGSIQESDSLKAIEVMEPMLTWVDLDDLNPDDSDVKTEIKRALGLYAMHKSIQIVTASEERVEAPGVAGKYIDACKTANEDVFILAEFAKKIPTLTKKSQDVMKADEKWENQDEALSQLDDPEITLGMNKYYEIMEELRRGVDYSGIWKREGLSLDGIPTVGLTPDKILTLARFRAWKYLSDDESSSNPSYDEYDHWKKDMSLLMGLTKNLSQDEQGLIRAELSFMENVLFENENA